MALLFSHQYMHLNNVKILFNLHKFLISYNAQLLNVTNSYITMHFNNVVIFQLHDSNILTLLKF